MKQQVKIIKFKLKWFILLLAISSYVGWSIDQDFIISLAVFPLIVK